MAEKKRILLLDDSAITLEMEKAVLEERGYKVAIASNLLEFQSQLDQFQPENHPHRPHDAGHLGQGHRPGAEAGLPHREIPIILFSSKGDDELQEISEQAGADGFMSKSHGIDKLGDMVDEMVDSILW